jgi:hypothetical protein
MTLLTRAMLLQKTGSNAFYFWISGETGPKEPASPDDAVPVDPIADDRPPEIAEAPA